ncbi:transposase-like protein [Limibacillus halophilus]|uniref:Transposase-like protein n=1 Tax=Limibacillus halophilus TaxID=1579333 RepID=A0A839SRX8_9PROT|nr:transposase-like protein [Limibacillus halophilus]
MSKRSPFRYFKASPEIIRLAVMMYIRFPLSLRSVEDLLHERGIDISHEGFDTLTHEDQRTSL